MDVIGTVVASFVLAPLMILIAIAVYRDLGRPVLFRQKRAGCNGRIFTIFKFRTMKGDPAGSSCDDRRISTLGAVLRRLSLDELPQLWNVLKGDMSLVGPRPLPVEYLPRYDAFQNRRHEVMPGITGWAQVNGRNGLAWERKFELDVWYVDHQSVRLDARILWMTMVKVVRTEGISRQGHATMPEFIGSVNQSRPDG
jgi:sugar transferase EpsL